MPFTEPPCLITCNVGTISPATANVAVTLHFYAPPAPVLISGDFILDGQEATVEIPANTQSAEIALLPGLYMVEGSGRGIQLGPFWIEVSPDTPSAVLSEIIINVSPNEYSHSTLLKDVVQAKNEAQAAAGQAAAYLAFFQNETVGTRSDMEIAILNGFVPRTGRTYTLDGVDYRGLLGSTIFPTLNGLTHGLDGIAPDHFGGKNRAHIEAAWAYFNSVGATGAGADLPALSSVPFLFLGGRYNADSTSVLVLETTGAGQRIEFRGNALAWHTTIVSRRKNLEVLNPFIVGGTYDMNDGILFEPPPGEGFRGGFVRNPRIFNVRNAAKTAASIRAKGNAAHIQVSDPWLQGSDYNYVAEAVDAGDSVGGMLFSGLHAMNARVNNIRLSSGGENRFVNYRIRGAAQEGVLITGNTDRKALEQYFGNGGITGNHTDLTTRASNPITTITDEGGYAKVTITGSHMFWAGLRSCRIQGTGILAYDDTTDVRCIEVGADYVVTNVAYAGDATGSLVHCGFDVKLQSESILGHVNDIVFNGANINSIGLFSAYNIQFYGCRLKVNAWASGCNSILRIGGFRGREGDPAWDDVPFVGQTGGIYEEGLSVPPGSDRNTLATLIKRTPRNSAGLGVDNLPAAYNSVGVHPVDGLQVSGPFWVDGYRQAPDFLNVAQMVAYSGHSEGTSVFVACRSAIGDRGAGTFVIMSAANWGGAVDDLGAVYALSGGLVAIRLEFLTDRRLEPYWFGATGTSTATQDTALNRWIAAYGIHNTQVPSTDNIVTANPWMHVPAGLWRWGTFTKWNPKNGYPNIRGDGSNSILRGLGIALYNDFSLGSGSQTFFRVSNLKMHGGNTNP